MHNQVALNYFLKMGGNQFLDLAKEIWNYLQSKRIMLSTEYTPNQSNWLSDWYSRNVQHNSEWKLCINVIRKIFQKMRATNTFTWHGNEIQRANQLVRCSKQDRISFYVPSIHSDWFSVYWKTGLKKRSIWYWYLSHGEPNNWLLPNSILIEYYWPYLFKNPFRYHTKETYSWIYPERYIH